MSPRLEAYAFRIWAYAEPLGWDVSVSDIARETGIRPNIVGRVVNEKGWASRLRVSESRVRDLAWMRSLPMRSGVPLHKFGGLGGGI